MGDTYAYLRFCNGDKKGPVAFSKPYQPIGVIQVLQRLVTHIISFVIHLADEHIVKTIGVPFGHQSTNSFEAAPVSKKQFFENLNNPALRAA